MFRDHYNVFFIGGSRIYHDCLEYVYKLYITHIYHSLQLNGVKFPRIDFSKFQEISHSPIKTIENVKNLATKEIIPMIFQYLYSIKKRKQFKKIQKNYNI